MTLHWRNLVISSFGVIALLLLTAGDSYSLTEAGNTNKSLSNQSQDDSLLYTTPSAVSVSNYFAVATTTTCASGRDTPTFKPGQVVSSDVFNEIFRRIDKIPYGFSSASELVGTWSCTKYTTEPSCLTSSHFVRDPSNLYSTLTDTVTFSNNGNGTYSYASSKYWLYECSTFANLADPIAVPESGSYTVLPNYILTRIDLALIQPYYPQWDGNTGFHMLQKITENRFLWKYSYGQRDYWVCDKQNIPPPAPTDLSASASGRNVTLAWTNSCDGGATSFKVLRKDSLTGNYSVVATLPTTVTSYTETVPMTGTFWYRVVATNSYGNSTGSNVADVTME